MMDLNRSQKTSRESHRVRNWWAVLKRLALCSLLLGFGLGLAGCYEYGVPAGKDKPWAEINPVQDMFDVIAYKWQEPQYRSKSMRHPPEGTVTQNWRTRAMSVPADKVEQIENPVPVTEETLEYGQKLYNTTCVTCHGKKGHGNGYIIGEQKYPKPPVDLAVGNSVDWPDGRIYRLITHGRNAMGSYKSQLYPMERWAVVNYVRALQRAANPHPRDRTLAAETGGGKGSQ